VGQEIVGFVPQRSDPNPTLPTTVREFVSLGLAGIRDEAAPRIEEALGNVGLTGFARRSLWTLSGGERQRALVARALVRRPRLLLVDEPTNHLDPVAEHTLLESICDLHCREGLTVVFVTHDLALAGKYGSHVALFAGGEVRSGPAERLLSASELKWAFGVPFEVRKDAGGAVGVHIRA
jgi:ABC-type cobalamin/Fe3+-siderophores transport system ATPase subunit